MEAMIPNDLPPTTDDASKAAKDVDQPTCHQQTLPTMAATYLLDTPASFCDYLPEMAHMVSQSDWVI